mgnify:CR=1 FL=1
MLRGGNNLIQLSGVSHLVIDECHRAAAASYQSIIAHVRGLNPQVKLLGLSATPFRADRVKLSFQHVIKDAGLGKLIRDNNIQVD